MKKTGSRTYKAETQGGHDVSGIKAIILQEDERLKEALVGEQVNHPAHYNVGKFEVIDVIHDWKLGFNLGNAVKYVARAGHKDPSKTIQDLKKAIWYIEDEIHRRELNFKP